MNFQPLDCVFLAAILEPGKKGSAPKNIISVVDYLDRTVPTYEMTKGALERLSAAGLVVERNGRYFGTRAAHPARKAMKGTNDRRKWLQACAALLAGRTEDGKACRVPTEEEYGKALDDYRRRE